MGGKRDLSFKKWLLFCFILSLVTSGLVISSPVLAQDDADEFTLEEIVVTGSRIARNNNQSTSPIVTVDKDMFDQASTSSIETQLNKLPQFTPTMDVPQIAGQDIQPTATNTPGEATVALRGIGANRTLVLINGRRGTPSNAMGVLDINTIPTAAIQYVEAISGGASSTYGADAMAGVLNFIMKDRFEGFQIDATGSITQEGDNEEYTISGVMGTNFADDRGNIMMAFAYNDRKGARQRDRSWFRDNWRNPEIGGTQFFAPLSGFSLGYSNLPDVETMNSVLDGATFTAPPAGAVIYYDPASDSAVTGFERASIPGISSAEAAGLVDGYSIKMRNDGYLAANNTETYLIFPLERYNFYTQGNYEINDHVGVFGQAYFNKTRARTIQEPGVLSGGWTVTIDPTINRNSIPTEILTILDARRRPVGPGEEGYITPTEEVPNPVQPTVSGAAETFDFGTALLSEPRVGNTDTFTFNMTTGLEGDIPGIDWTYEVFVSHGEAETTSNMTGFYSLERMRAIMTLPDFGAGAEITGNEEYANFGAATATCTSGINPYDWASVTQDCWEAVAAPVKTRQIMEQTIWEANTQGAIVDLPMGEMRGSLGVSYRENNYQFLSDNINTQGRSFNDQVLGLYPSGESEGTIKAKEAYAELLVPVLKDIPFVEQLEVNLGGRRSDYNTTGVSYTYKAELNWKTTEFLRFRGGYNRAERAPNIAELYLARTSSFGAMSYGDACSMKNRLSYSANPVYNDDWADIVNLCSGLMNLQSLADDEPDYEFYGAQAADIVAYGNANPVPTDAAAKEAYVTTMRTALGISDDDWDQQPNAGFSWIWPVDIGNSTLKPEIADTWTFGFVLDSFVEGIPALMDWRISLDYYTIEISDAIGLQTGDVVVQQCLDPTFNPTADYQSAYCAGYTRNPESGALATLERSYYNNGRFQTSGIDMQINWGMEAGPGRVSVSTLVNYLLEMKSAELPTNPLVDYVGTFGPSGNGLNGNSFEWRSLTTVTYSMSDWDVSLRWQHLDKLENITGTNTPLPSYDMFDLLGNYRLKDNISFRFGIENLFNTAPKLYNRDYTNTSGFYGGSFSSANHDLNGRRFYVGTKVYF